ncbi:MAG: SDR family oxidoreductase [Gemmatimonadaceae bacterium]
MPEATSAHVGARRVAVVGAAGYVGSKVIERLLKDRRQVEQIVAIDVREVPIAFQQPDVVYDVLDARSAELSERFREHNVDCVVHLASVVSPPPDMSVHDQYATDVDGTHNLVESCLTADVGHVIVVSSGAAYGYHADNPVPITEAAPLRGNEAFAHARHKRLVEEFLARYREAHPELAQLVLRPGMILGERTSNAVTALFMKPVIVGVAGSECPFGFVRDDDVADCIIKGIHERRTGVFNLTGDGVVTLRQIATRTGAHFLEVPADVLAMGLWALRVCHVSPYGPEQVAFLRYRPVLSNERLKRDFGFTPTMTSREVFELWWASRRPLPTS